MARTFTTPAPVRVWESHLRLYRTIWRSNVLGAFVQPFLYLLGMGLGVGALVDSGPNADLLGGLTYFEFLAPALLATSAMLATSLGLRLALLSATRRLSFSIRRVLALM